MTYSIIVLDKQRDLLGIGVVSGSIAVGSRVPWGRYGIGGIVSQAYTNPGLGSIILDYMERGHDVDEAIKRALNRDKHPSLRQIAAMNWDGNASYYNGSNIPLEYGGFIYRECVAIANLVVSNKIPKILCKTYYENAGDDIGLSIIHALMEAHSIGGDRRGDRSSALLIIGLTEFTPYYDRIIDIRVDYAMDPIKNLEEIYNLYRKQLL